jgi:ribonuclease Z
LILAEKQDMPKILFLGTSYSIPDERHGNTQLAILVENRTVIVDVSGDPVVRLEKAGIDPLQVTDLVVTHFHPDHAGGIPILLMDMWLMKRREPLAIYGLDDTLGRVESMLQLYEWKSWKNLYPVNFHKISGRELQPLIQAPGLNVSASQTKHFIPSIGLRMEFGACRAKVAYSSDTAPCAEVAVLGKGVDYLIHEVTGASEGHSSARQAGEIAEAAGARCLYLIHYPAREVDPVSLIPEAQAAFHGTVRLAEDFGCIEIP